MGSSNSQSSGKAVIRPERAAALREFLDHHANVAEEYVEAVGGHTTTSSVAAALRSLASEL